MNLPRLLTLSLLLILGLSTACSRPTLPSTPASKTQEEFLKICQEEYKMPVQIFQPGSTLWVYLPREENFLDIKASPEGPQSSTDAQETSIIKYLDGNFEDNSFRLAYDIERTKNYLKDYGYSTQYSEQYKADQRNVLTAFYRVFSNSGTEETSQPDPSPNFLVFLAADIKNGVEIKTIAAAQDIKRVMMDPSFQEEYTRRIIIDYPVGNTKIIDDRLGRHLDIHALTWPEFLTKQMLHRIRSKYQQSSFPPSENAQEEILKIAAQTLNAYQFWNFTSLGLNNLADDSYVIFTSEELKKFIQDINASSFYF